MTYIFAAIGIAFLALLTALGFEHTRVIYETNRAVAAEQAVKAAEARAVAQAAQWSAQAALSAKAALNAKEKTDAEIAALKARIAKLPDRVVVFDTATASLFTDIAHAANATAPAVSDQSAPAPVPPPATAEALFDEREVTTWLADAAKAYRDARQKWQSCVDFYGALQKGSQ